MDDETLGEIVEQPIKAKKPRSQKQIEQFERIRAIRDANRKARAEERALQEAQNKKELEDKIVKKAISIKKKQILKQKVLDEVSDDETPIEEVKEIVKSTPKILPEKTNLREKEISNHQLKEPNINNPRFFFC